MANDPQTTPPSRKELLRRLRKGGTTQQENFLIIKQSGEIIDHCAKRCKQIAVLYVVFCIGAVVYGLVMAP